MKKLIASAAIAATSVAGLAGTASADTTAGLVAIDISNVDVLTDNNVTVADVADVNAALAVPVGIAANVCGVSVAALLAGIEGGDTTCTASNTQRSQAAVDQVQRIQIRNAI